MVGRRANKSHKRTRALLAYDVVCIGRPAQDTFLKGDVFKPVCSHGSCYEHIPLGEKIEVEDLEVAYGGNALNASITFARQKLKVGLLAQLGLDSVSSNIAKMAELESVDLSLADFSEDFKPAQSTIIVAPSGERSVMAFKGTAVQPQVLLHALNEVEEVRWLYVSSLNSLELLEGVFEYARLNGVQVAFNPGGLEVTNHQKVKEIIKDVDLLVMNKQEAQLFFGSGDSKSLAKKGASLARTCIVTDGPKGSWASDGSEEYFQPISSDQPVVDRNGAGDAFASGVVAGLAWGMDLRGSLLLGAQNSTSVVGKIGAQTGILRRE